MNEFTALWGARAKEHKCKTTIELVLHSELRSRVVWLEERASCSSIV